MKPIQFATALALLCAVVAACAETPKPYPSHMRWWADARFGMFIHWGPVSLTGQEISWSRANTNPNCPNSGPIPADVYDSLYKRFNPTKFDAKQWVRIAKGAGMKYMVLTAKHCDGFLLWNSKVSDYNIINTPFHRDVCGELAKACHEAGIRIGWYFSPMDWKDPDCRGPKNDEFVKRMQAEIRELLTNYGRIDLLWFDCDGGTVPWDQEATYAMVRKLQPNIVIDNRLDLGPGMGAASPASVGPHADYFTPEQWIGGYCDQCPWESCMTVSKKNQWSWGGPDDGVKTLSECLDMLIGCAGGDGNVLLDVGPMPSGEIPPLQVGLLRQIGSWWAKYGVTVRGTRGGPFKPSDYGSSTRSGNTVYLNVRAWDHAALRLPALPAKIVGTRVLTGGEATVVQTTRSWSVSVPANERNPFDTIVALDLDRPAAAIDAVDVPPPASLSQGAKAIASNVYHDLPEYGPDKAVDGRMDTRWATDSGLHSAWLELDLAKPATIGEFLIVQAFPELHRVRRFAVEYWADGKWNVCYSGKDLGARLAASFKPVVARKVRLNITEATDGPTIWEFKLFEPGS